jgi:ABC-type lipoprotein export system ATPase subunit
MRFAGISNRQRRARALELLKLVGLENRANHKPTELSGGQQQRVAIARSLVNNPPLILADEPTGNLDTSSGLSIMQTLSELHHAGRTVLVVTHDPRMVHFSTHTIRLLDGKVVDEATYNAATAAGLDFGGPATETTPQDNRPVLAENNQPPDPASQPESEPRAGGNP